MKPKTTSYAFLLEMIWVSAFFLICVTIFVMVFVKAEQLSRQADTLNQAVQAVSNTLEEAFCESDPIALQELCDSNSTDSFFIHFDSNTDDGLLMITVHAVDPVSQETIYSLTGARALPSGGES